MATAAHCPDASTYYNPNNTSIPLTLVAGTAKGYGSQDVLVHTSAYVERPEFYVNTEKPSSAARWGMSLCTRRGKATERATPANDWG